MILIWDNGWDYSMHEIHFVKFDPAVFSEEELVAAFNKSADYDEPRSHVIAVINDDAIDWRAPDAYEEPGDLITIHKFVDTPWNEPARIKEESWDPIAVAKLLPMWRKKPLYTGYSNHLPRDEQGWYDLVEARLKAETKTNE